jgi:anti-sigma factor RsiW
VAQQYDGHLTTEQLSVFLDKQLSREEQLDLSAHLRACQQCQRRLADLRQTVALLHALPQAELPRSFVLPGSTTLAPERPLQPVRQGTRTSESGGLITPIPLAHRRRRSILQRSVRALSTIAAAVGFILILSGLLAGAHLGVGGGTFATNTASSGAGQTTTSGAVPAPNAGRPNQPAHAASTAGGPERPGAATPQVTRTPSETVRSAPTTGPVQDHTSSVPPVLNLSTSEGQEGVGLILLVLGFLGLVVMRIVRRRDART